MNIGGANTITCSLLAYNMTVFPANMLTLTLELTNRSVTMIYSHSKHIILHLHNANRIQRTENLSLVQLVSV